MIKNKITYTNKFKNLHDMIIKTVVLNNHQYKRRLKKKNKFAVISVRRSKEKSQKLYYDSQFMKLNAMHRILMNAHDKMIIQEQVCYICNKVEHYFRECSQNKNRNKSKFNDKYDKFFATMKESSVNDH